SGTDTSTHHEPHDSAHNEHNAGEEAYNAEEVVMHHISDAHDWHILTVGHTHISVPLPIIIYSKEKGLSLFLSSSFKAKEADHGHNAAKFHDGYILFHEKIYIGAPETTIETDAEGHVTNLTKVTDFSITKNVASMMVSFGLLALIFISVARAYAKRGNAAPKGLQSFMEPLILFVRNDI